MQSFFIGIKHSHLKCDFEISLLLSQLSFQDSISFRAENIIVKESELMHSKKRVFVSIKIVFGSIHQEN
jgi:hypothetical protein